jgi:hypothetical protein
MVINMKFDIDTINNTLKVTAKGKPDAIPEKKGIVRIQDFNATWEVQDDHKNHLVIRYFLSVNPGGSVSPGINNMFITKGPFQTFNNLSALLKE